MLNAINEEIVYVNGHPRKLVVFLHGYIDNADYLEHTILPMISNIDNAAVHLPQAPISCEILDDKRQWYSMHRFDPDDARKTVPTMEECVQIYDHMAQGLEEARFYLDEYIDASLNEYQLEDKDLYLCGFSQGAMLALYTALMRENKIGGCISFSGIMASHSFLMKHHRSAPDILLMHGNKDNLVRFEALEFTRHNLEQIGCRVFTYVVDGGQHRITPDELEQAERFINGRGNFRKKIAV